MYREYKGLDLPQIDKDILAFWMDQKIFSRSLTERQEGKPYVFYEGPPSANGKPGIHHVMARTVKDLFCRYHTMKGSLVERKGGWDTHGLPIELSVEKELGITKEDIGKTITIEEYNAKCRETVMRYKDLWDDITLKMGYWVDLDHPYITFENDYIESIWWLLRQLYDKGLLYKGYTIQPFSPAAGTGLSTHELNMPGAYREVKDVSAVAQFEVVKDAQSTFLYDQVSQGKVYFLAWTTTPWTLPSNTGLAVGAQIEYVLVATYNPYTFEAVNLILARDLIGAWFKPEQAEIRMEDYQAGDKIIPYRMLASFKGEQLEMIRYHQLLPYAQPEGEAFIVMLGDFVSTEDGTGIVHIAPSFGADDMRVASKYGVGALTLVDKQGKFVDEVIDFAGRYVKDYKDEGDAYINVDIDIVTKLKKENKLFGTQKYVHNYPHCWRTDKPVLYYPMDSWFIRSSSCRDRMVELNKEINWKPAHTGEKRFANWLENLQDWNLSRSRFWGTPLPIWRTEDGTAEVCIGSVEQLRQEIEKANKTLGLDQKAPEDLHRPFIDEVVLTSETGMPMHREPDLIDVWFDSGSMPYAQWHYPFENNQKFKDNFPADFIAEGVDQTRGWFFTLHAIAAMVFDSVAFKNVVSNGLVQDKLGRKMSKRLGNTVEPFQTIAQYGADPTRWYMISNAQPWDNLKFDIEGVEEVRRKFFGTLYNTYAFFALYANIDGYKGQEQRIPVSKRPEIDQWVLSELHSLIQGVDGDYADYEPTNATRKIQYFVDEHLSNWYVRLCRRRFWKGDVTEDKLAAYQTLYECLVTLAKLMSPVAPFFADWLYRNLNEVTHQEDHPSVHLSLFPQADNSIVQKSLEEKMEYAQRIASMVLSLRKKERIRVRQPLPRVLIPVVDDHFKAQIEAVADLIKAEVNVKAIEFVDDASGVIKKKAKANFKTLGKLLGKAMKEGASRIEEMTQQEIQQLEQEGAFALSLSSGSYTLTPEDVVITSEDIPGWQVVSDRELTLALDTQLTPELIAEGTARELINRIQNIRKLRDFNVTDRIVVRLSDHEVIREAVREFSGYICNETLADQLIVESSVEGEPVDLFDEVAITIDAQVVGS
ncbi:MAG: isoleucine--tRNA ligase [Lewinellaceae bacterium]|nr:isoleucine--tRNA ligase [Lewinellaceae bacterium]HPQ99414.1 isoleucine--tRNA ligase [Saprospiraceae bacterium]